MSDTYEIKYGNRHCSLYTKMWNFYVYKFKFETKHGEEEGRAIGQLDWPASTSQYLASLVQLVDYLPQS